MDQYESLWYAIDVLSGCYEWEAAPTVKKRLELINQVMSFLGYANGVI